MASFPDSVYEPREIENVPGVTYDSSKKKWFFAEDLNKATDEIVALENTLGTNPEGNYDTVSERIAAVEDGGSGMSNPMTTVGDVIVGGTSGAPVRLGVGGANTFLVVDSSGVIPEWSSEDIFHTFTNTYQGFVNPVFKRIQLSNLSIGDNTLYTCPSDKIAFMSSSVRFYNTSAGSMTCYLTIKRSGTHYRVSSSATTSTLTDSSCSLFGGFVLTAGEISSINVATNNGANVISSVIEMDVTSLIKTASIFGLSNGDNTLYTCPAGKQAFVTNGASGLNITIPSVCICNDSGASRIYYIYNVPSGQSPATAYRVAGTTSINDKTATTVSTGCFLTEGDSIVLNTNSGVSTQNCWLTHFEYPV